MQILISVYRYQHINVKIINMLVTNNSRKENNKNKYENII